MKVILISNSSWNLSNFRIDLIKKLIKKKVKVHTIAPFDDDTKKLLDLGCQHTSINLKKRSINPFFEFITFINLFKIIYKIKPNYILTFTIKPNIYASIISKFLRFKIIINITGLGSSLIRQNLLFYFILLIYKFSFSKTNMIFFQNSDDLEFFRKYNLIQNKYKVIPGSGVNLKYFNVNNFNTTNKDIDFLYVGRLIKDKGINEFCKASVKLIKKEKIKAIIYVITHDIQNINYYTKKFPDIYFKSKVSDIRFYYLRSKCTVLPSYREGTPRSLLESCAMKTPIIASDVVGCREVLVNDYNGLFCEPFSTESLLKTMKKFTNLSKEKKLLFSKNARSFVEKNYDSKIISNHYCKILNLEP